MVGGAFRIVFADVACASALALVIAVHKPKDSCTVVLAPATYSKTSDATSRHTIHQGYSAEIIR